MLLSLTPTRLLPFVHMISGSVPASSSAVPSGISYQLSYRLVPNADAVFFSQLFIIPDYARSCPLKLHLRLTNTLAIYWANFRSTCLGVRVGMLEFTSNLHHTVIFPGLSSPSPSVPASSKLFISSVLSEPSVQLGNFFTLLPQGSGVSSLTVSFPSGSSNPTATLYNTNVTVFDNVINTAVSIQGSNMQFSGQTTIFGSYQVSVTGLSSTEKRWSSLPLRYEGIIQGAFGAELNTYLAGYIAEEVNDTKTRRQNAQASLNNAEQQLLTITQKQNAKLLELQTAYDDLETLNSTVHYVRMQVYQAELTYNQTLTSHSQAEQASMNITCTEQPCNYVCQPGVNCTTCYNNMQLVESGTCIRYVTQAVEERMSRPVPEQYWGYIIVCTPCWSWVRIFIFCFSTREECCNTVCVSMTRYRLEYFSGTIYKTVAMEEPCVVNTIDTSTPSQCCMQYPCAYTVRDPLCVAANLQCEQQKQEAFAALGNAGEALSQSYATYTQAKANATMAELQVSAKVAEIASIQQELNLINSAHESAQIGYNISLNEHSAVFQQTESKIPLVQLHDTYGASQLLLVQQLFFNVTVTTETPVIFPVLMNYDTPYSSQSNQRMTVINFEAPKDLTLRGIAGELVSQITEGGVGRKRSVKRQIETRDTLVTTFQKRCSDLINLQDYFEQLLTAVNMTKNQTKLSTDVISKITTQMGDTFSAFSSEEGDTASTLGARAMAALGSLATQREESAFTEWQTSMVMLHNGTGSVADYDCYGFTDCLHTTLSILQRVLVDTPLDEATQLLQQLRESKQSVEQLGIYKNLTLDDAKSALLEIADIVNETDALDYWCAGLPEFTEQPPAEVNISIASTLHLVTTVESELPIRYRWKKDGILINGQYSSTLVLHNIQMVDSGKYVCLATTDTGTVSSFSSVVNVYYAPVFNRTLRPAVVREGEDNGVNFECDAHSWPPPGWSWYFRPNSSVVWEQIADADANLLPLLNPGLESEGWYQCVAHNWIGQGTRAAYLTILPATVVRIKYPVRFRLLMTDEEISGDDAHNITEEVNGSGVQEPTFGDSLNHSLTIQLTLTTTKVEDAVYREENTVLDLTFNFITPYFKFENMAETSVEDALQVAASSMMNLESDKTRLESALESHGLYVDHDKVRYRIINGSFTFGTRAFVCPEGYGLHSSLVLCGE